MNHPGLFVGALLIGCLFLLQGCDDDEEDPPPLPETYNPVPATGKAIVFRAESVVDPISRQDSGMVSLSAAVYVDQIIQLMVGGDYVRAGTATAATALSPDSSRPGAFSGLLNDRSADKQVGFEIDYDPTRSAGGRWFSAPELLLDPGAGEYVGTRATVEFPPPLLITSPLNDQPVDRLDENIRLSWQIPAIPASPNDHVRVGWSHTCSGFREDYRRGVIELPPASVAAGLHVFQLRNFLISEPEVDALSTLLVNLAFLPIVVLTGELINVPPVPTGTCLVYLTLYNDRMHPLPAGFAGGEVAGSRTDTIRLRYTR